MRNIPQFEPWLDNAEQQQLCGCINDNWITGGPRVKEFERRIAELVGVKHAISCSNGTTALYLGLLALGIEPGDFVVVPDFTFIASANAVTWTGAKPIFADIDKDTLCMTAETVQAAVNAFGKRREGRIQAIMPIGIYGNSPDMDKLRDLAESEELLMIEDAAQDIGVSWAGRPLGSWGEVGCLSFYADKTITTGEGGMVLTDVDQIAADCVMLMNQGRTGRGFYVHDYVGYNFRMTDLQAGVGLAQLDKLPEIIKRKRAHEQMYARLLYNVERVNFVRVDPKCKDVPFRHNILVGDPTGLMAHLQGKGIGAREFFLPLHRQPPYKRPGSFLNSDWAHQHGLSLPSSALLKDEEIEYVCSAIKEYVNR
ncbi:hypothetical protein LCGC14_0968670 [marine sediment metagenome]|uniref:Uncharacterized protein n=1 Tax=marine sediment metagenome TaxID=412755 RepID=A0A0F9NYG2_9ZZZZ